MFRDFRRWLIKRLAYDIPIIMNVKINKHGIYFKENYGMVHYCELDFEDFEMKAGDRVLLRGDK